MKLLKNLLVINLLLTLSLKVIAQENDNKGKIASIATTSTLTFGSGLSASIAKNSYDAVKAAKELKHYEKLNVSFYFFSGTNQRYAKRDMSWVYNLKPGDKLRMEYNYWSPSDAGYGLETHKYRSVEMTVPKSGPASLIPKIEGTMAYGNDYTFYKLSKSKVELLKKTRVIGIVAAGLSLASVATAGYEYVTNNISNKVMNSYNRLAGKEVGENKSTDGKIAVLEE